MANIIPPLDGDDKVNPPAPLPHHPFNGVLYNNIAVIIWRTPYPFEDFIFMGVDNNGLMYLWNKKGEWQYPEERSQTNPHPFDIRDSEMLLSEMVK